MNRAKLLFWLLVAVSSAWIACKVLGYAGASREMRASMRADSLAVVPTESDAGSDGRGSDPDLSEIPDSARQRWAATCSAAGAQDPRDS